VGFYVALSPVSEFVRGRIGVVPIDVVVYLLLIRLYLRRSRADAWTARSAGPTISPPPGAIGGA
jgi:hypothetical protein